MANAWPTRGPRVANAWPTRGQRVANSWPTRGPRAANAWPTHGQFINLVVADRGTQERTFRDAL
eukprot:6217769-Lingulodinium_polyedra.AAC.1